MSEDQRWIVKRAKGGIEDVGADALHLLDSGALLFLDAAGVLAIAYAPGTWVTVVPGDR